MAAGDPLIDNPFFVLELTPTASAMDVERQGKMLLAKLELGLEAAASYPSPIGRRTRTPDDVRRAMQALSDPRRRLAVEPFATARCIDAPHVGHDDDDDAVDIAPLLWWRP